MGRPEAEVCSIRVVEPELGIFVAHRSAVNSRTTGASHLRAEL